MERVILEIVHPYTTAHSRIVVSSGRALIGRGYHCDVILDDPYVSEEHVEVTLCEDGTFLLTDRGSVNGVHTGARKITDMPARISSGQEIKIGKTRIKIFSPRHAMHPAQPHNLLSSIFQFCDRPAAGFLISVIAAVLVVCENARVESGNIDFWKKEAFGVGAGFFLYLSIVWAIIHIVLVIKDKKFMPWPRIMSYLSVVGLVVSSFEMLIWPYVDFYLLSPASILIFTGVSLAVFWSLFEYSYCIVCELRKPSVKSMLYSAVVIISLVAVTSIDMEFDSDPAFPHRIVSADLPLFSVQPLDVFIEQAFARD